MTRVLKLFLPICILLLSGFIQLNGHLHESFVFFSSSKAFTEPDFSGCFTASDCQGLTLRSALSDTERANRLNHQAKIEEKEDELVSLKKLAEFSSGFTVAFYTQAPAQFGAFIKPGQVLFRRVFHFLPYRSLFLRLKVLRI